MSRSSQVASDTTGPGHPSACSCDAVFPSRDVVYRVTGNPLPRVLRRWRFGNRFGRSRPRGDDGGPPPNTAATRPYWSRHSPRGGLGIGCCVCAAARRRPAAARAAAVPVALHRPPPNRDVYASRWKYANFEAGRCFPTVLLFLAAHDHRPSLYPGVLRTVDVKVNNFKRTPQKLILLVPTLWGHYSL